MTQEQVKWSKYEVFINIFILYLYQCKAYSRDRLWTLFLESKLNNLLSEPNEIYAIVLKSDVKSKQLKTVHTI